MIKTDADYSRFLEKIIGAGSSDLYTAFEKCVEYDIDTNLIYSHIHFLTDKTCIDYVAIVHDIILGEVRYELDLLNEKYNMDIDTTNIPLYHAEYMATYWEYTGAFISMIKSQLDFFMAHKDEAPCTMKLYNELI